jgi:soluble cytochrome b562
LEHLGEYAQFYNSMLFPLVQQCPPNGYPWDSSFDFKDRFELHGGTLLCRYVIGLNELFTNLDKQNQLAKDGKQQPKKGAKSDENIRQQIYTHIHKHNNDLLIDDCRRDLNSKRVEIIENKSWEIRKNKEELNKAFEENFHQLIEELDKEERESVHDLHERRAVAYKLIEIGKKMGDVFNANEEEQMEWAFQLFAAQLAVYSLRLDTLPTSVPHQKIAIHAIAKRWPIGIKIETGKPSAAAGEHSGIA